MIWYAARLDPPAWTILRIPFRPAIWQLLFIIGVMAGYFQDQIRRWRLHQPIPRWLASTLVIGSAAALLVLSYQIAFNHLWPNVEWLGYQGILFNQGTLGVGRILASIWVFAAMYDLATWIWVPLKRWLGWLLIPLGQQALIAYIIQAFLSYAVTRLPGFPFPDHDPTLMGFLHLAAVLAVWFATGLSARLLPKILHWIQLRRSPLPD
jgi:OpgC protein